MKLAAPATAAVVTVFLAGLSGSAASGGRPGRDLALSASGVRAAAPGRVTLASHDTGYGSEPRPAVSPISGASPSATRAAGASPGPPAPVEGRVGQATTVPVPSGMATSPAISSVACPSARECVAVGYYNDSSGNLQGLLLTGHGSSWAAAKPPVPAGAATRPDTILSGVACPSARECVAIGSYNDSAGNYQGLLLTRHGSSWTAAKPPLPAGADASLGESISGVACASAAACTAVGAYTDASGNAHPSLLTMRGSSWTAATAPLPVGASVNLGAYISVLDCPSATACTAVGIYYRLLAATPSVPADQVRIVMDGGHGTAARPQSPPLPLYRWDSVRVCHGMCRHRHVGPGRPSSGPRGPAGDPAGVDMVHGHGTGSRRS